MNVSRIKLDKFDKYSRCSISSFASLALVPNMASERFQALLEDLEPREYFETFAIAVPVHGSQPIISNSGDEAYETVLEIIKTNNYLAVRANEVQSKANKFVKTLRGLAHILSAEENRCEETNLHLENIARLVAIAEKDADIGYKIARIELLKFDTDQHRRVEDKLAAAELELQMVKDDLKEAIERMVKLTKLKKAIDDCINIGHDNLAFF